MGNNIAVHVKLVSVSLLNFSDILSVMVQATDSDKLEIHIFPQMVSVALAIYNHTHNKGPANASLLY